MTTTLKISLALLIGLAAGVLITRALESTTAESTADPFAEVNTQLDHIDFKVMRPTGQYTAEQDTIFHRAMRLVNRMTGGPVPYECLDAPTRPITKDEALDLIERYRNSPLELYTHVGDHMENLRGWFIERDSILRVLSSHPDANGLQLYLGRKNAPGYDPLTIVWAARRRVEEDYCSRWDNKDGNALFHKMDNTHDTVWWYDSHDYLRPCPPDCPTK